MGLDHHSCFIAKRQQRDNFDFKWLFCMKGLVRQKGLQKTWTSKGASVISLLVTDILHSGWCQLQNNLANRPFPSSPGLLFQNEGRCSAFDMEIIFLSHANKTHFHKKGCAPSIILKMRVFGTRKWPITSEYWIFLFLQHQQNQMVWYKNTSLH